MFSKNSKFFYSRFFYKRILLFRVKFFFILYKSMINGLHKYSFLFKSFLFKIFSFLKYKKIYFFRSFFFSFFNFSFYSKFFDISKLYYKMPLIFTSILQNISVNRKFFFINSFLKVFFFNIKTAHYSFKRHLFFYFYFLKRFVFDLVPLSFFNLDIKNNNFIASSYKVVNYDIVIFLVKKLNYDKIFKNILIYFRLLHINSKLVLRQRNRIFFLYLFLRKFLSFY